MITIITILLISLVISLWVNAVMIISDEGQILYFITKWLTWLIKYIPNNMLWILKPIWFCPQCMCSVHGAIVYYLLSIVCNFQFDILQCVISCVIAVFPTVYIRQIYQCEIK
jgi:hypothetical protein